jgi:hypothetical protein
VQEDALPLGSARAQLLNPLVEDAVVLMGWLISVVDADGPQLLLAAAAVDLDGPWGASSGLRLSKGSK